MGAQLCFFCCGNFAAEVGAAVAAEGWRDVSVVDFPARCGRPPLSWEALRSLLPPDCTQVILFGRACIHELGDAPADFPPARVVPVQQCFHLVAGEALVDEAISMGGYLITPAWLADWCSRIEALGFTAENVGEYFHEFARELVLLDTGIRADTPAHAASLEAAVRLPVRRIPVGLDMLRFRLARRVLEWRLRGVERAAKAESRRHASELADHVAAMDILVRLTKTQDETEAIAAIEDLFRMLFAPGDLHYMRVENDNVLPCTPLPESIRAQLVALRDDYAWTPDGQGFVLRIARGDESLGLLAVERFAVPQHRERYLNMALAVTGVCALSIESARHRKHLVEAEKMASLGILVAGVAHEVNTPLGVCLAAGTTLQADSQQLKEQFDARSMTQSDLARYLDKAATSTSLLRRNLERIGSLVDAFRKVALDDAVRSANPFHLRAHIDDVVRSLGNRLAADGVEVVIDCPADIVLESGIVDWSCIFRNLVENSLKHGFRHQEGGVIEVRVARDGHRLCVEYQDDGLGMSEESLGRVFDPFYTTDLQQSMGLGMHLVYNLVVHRMGGHISCDSAPGHGVRFQIETPL